MQKQVIRLSKQERFDIENNNKFIGSGKDGNLYKVGSNVFKFYKDNKSLLDSNKEGIYDSDGVNVTNYKNLRNKSVVIDNRILSYVDGEGVILAREEAILKAIELGEKVKQTYLPNNIIYDNNKAIGCVYPYYKNTLGIYASSLLPLRLRLQICKEIISKVEELLDNNIYPLSLAQRSDEFPISKKESNILLGLDLKTYIVDLDGNSTLYSQNYSHKHTTLALASLSTLVLEILSKIKIYDDNFSNMESIIDYKSNECFKRYIDDMIEEFVKAGIPEHFAHKYYEYGKLEMSDIKRLVREVEKHR
jgi:hypothetical protein